MADYNAHAAQIPDIGPVPGLIPWWGFLAGQSNASAAQAYMDLLTPAFNRWRTHDPSMIIELALTLPFRLAPRVRRHRREVGRWLAAAVYLAAGANGARLDSFPNLSITVTYDRHVTGWGEAVVHLKYPKPE